MKIDASNSKVNFTVKKLFFLTVKGVLPEVKGTVNSNENTVLSINVNIPITNINTKSKKRDEHLLQDDFFNIAKHPEITFVSTKIIQEGSQFFAIGNLSMVGTTKQVKFPFQFVEGRITGKLSVNRLDYKIGQIPTFVVAKEIFVTFDCLVK